MKVIPVHSLELSPDQFKKIQNNLAEKIDLSSSLPVFRPKACAGVDLAYWKENGIELGVCSIVVVDSDTGSVIEKVSSKEKISVPYIPGYLAFRELPLILQTVTKLTTEPDVFLFDGNGYLHPRHMGIATHAAFFLNKPTIGVAKSYFKINQTDYEPPANQKGAFTDITVNGDVYGRALRTRKDVKPLFVSCGNFIDLDTATLTVLSLIGQNSRQPIPIRMADMESKRIKGSEDRIYVEKNPPY